MLMGLAESSELSTTLRPFKCGNFIKFIGNGNAEHIIGKLIKQILLFCRSGPCKHNIKTSRFWDLNLLPPNVLRSNLSF